MSLTPKQELFAQEFVKLGNDIELHIDHIIPYSLGGTNEEDNLQVLCRDCNISKGNRFGVNHNE